MKTWKRRLVSITAVMLLIAMTLPMACALSGKTTSLTVSDEEGNNINNKSLSLYIGDLYNVTIGGKYEVYDQVGALTVLEDDIVHVSSSDSSVAVAVDDTTIRAVGEGTATISVSIYDVICDESGATAKVEANWSTTVTVKQRPYENPFAGIDPDKVENPFEDISSDEWYYDYIIYLYAAGFYDGVDFGDGKEFDNPGVDKLAFPMGNAARVVPLSVAGKMPLKASPLAAEKTNFNPNASENRANTVTVLYNGHKGMGGTVGSYTNNKFYDIDENKAYYQPVLWANATSVVKGYGGGLFGPLDGVTREQFCAILVRYAERYGFQMPTTGKAKTFKDGGSISDWAKDAVVACQKAGIINGMNDGTFRPKDGITRAQVATMIYRFINNCVGGSTV